MRAIPPKAVLSKVILSKAAPLKQSKELSCHSVLSVAFLRVALLSLVALLVFSDASFGSSRNDKLREIEALIDNGSPDEAARKLSELASANARSPEELIIVARLESDGKVGAGFLRAALKGAEYPRQREKIYLDLARYYQALGNLPKLRIALSQHRREFPRSEFRDEFTKLRVFLAEREGEFSQAKSLCRRALKGSSKAEMREWSRLALARFELREKATHRGGRNNAFRISSSQSSSLAPVALYLLAEDDTRANDYDQAALDFNILREAYPNAIGAYDLIEHISGIDAAADKGEAEKLIGSFYSIQVGVFTVKDNARSQKKQFENYGEPVEIARKTISGKRYYAVYVGRFVSADAAAVFKRTLERSEKDLFNIALRQK